MSDSKKISALPLYSGPVNPVGYLPMTIGGVTYKIAPDLLGQLPVNVIAALLGAAAPSASNVYATMNDVLISGYTARIVKEKDTTPYVFEGEDYLRTVLLASGSAQTVTLDNTVDFPDDSVLVVKNFNNVTATLSALTGVLFSRLGFTETSISIPAGYTAIITKINNGAKLWAVSFESLAVGISQNYTDDTDATINGIAVGSEYHTDGVKKIRLT